MKINTRFQMVRNRNNTVLYTLGCEVQILYCNIVPEVSPYAYYSLLYDHGMLLQARGTLQLSIGDMVNALSILRNSLYCFSKAFEGDEALSAEKRKELEGLLQMVGLPQDTAQELLTGE